MKIKIWGNVYYGRSIDDLLSFTPFVKSKSEGRRLIKQNAIRINDYLITNINTYYFSQKWNHGLFIDFMITNNQIIFLKKLKAFKFEDEK